MKRIAILLATLLVCVTAAAEEHTEGKADPACGDLTCIDLDGNTYETVDIDGRIWTTTNFRGTLDRNGGTIGFHAQDEAFGHLYDSSSIMAHETWVPDGWRIPTEEEWRSLLEKNALDRLLHQESGQAEGTSGFDIVLAGMWDFTGVFQWQGTSFLFAGLSDDGSGIVHFFLDQDQGKARKGNFHPKDGASVRLVRAD